MRTLSAPAVASQNAENTAEVWLVLVTIDHPALAQPIRVVGNNENITSGGNLFVAYDFNIVLPGEDPDNPAAAQLDIDNVDRVIVQTLREISSPPSVTIQVVLASSPDLIEIEFAGLVLRNAQYDAMRVTADLAFDEIISEPVATTLSPDKFPGMF